MDKKLSVLFVGETTIAQNGSIKGYDLFPTQKKNCNNMMWFFSVISAPIFFCCFPICAEAEKERSTC